MILSNYLNSLLQNIANRRMAVGLPRGLSVITMIRVLRSRHVPLNVFRTKSYSSEQHKRFRFASLHGFPILLPFSLHMYFAYACPYCDPHSAIIDIKHLWKNEVFKVKHTVVAQALYKSRGFKQPSVRLIILSHCHPLCTCRSSLLFSRANVLSSDSRCASGGRPSGCSSGRGFLIACSSSNCR